MARRSGGGCAFCFALGVHSLRPELDLYGERRTVLAEGNLLWSARGRHGGGGGGGAAHWKEGAEVALTLGPGGSFLRGHLLLPHFVCDHHCRGRGDWMAGKSAGARAVSGGAA